MKRPLFLFFSLLMAICSLQAATRTSKAHTLEEMKDQSFLRLSDGAVIPFSQVLDDLRKVRLVFIGELHDQPSHHWAQLEVVHALRNAGRKVAIGVEMFRAEEQGKLDQWVQGKLSTEHFKSVYSRNWGESWALYEGIFLYSRENGIPLVGLNLPREVTRQVAHSGFQSLTPEQLQGLPPISCNVDPVYQEFIRRALGTAGKKGLAFQHFCEAQLLWDGAMAWHALQFMEKNPDYTVVVLAGSGHSWKRAAPEQVRRLSTIPYRVILPELPKPGRSDVTPEDADYLWLNLPLNTRW